ncbi:MAG: hypothetical protein RIS68_1472 [Bacteroidota bacterium]
MNSFTSYLVLGLQHILNIQAIDHLLFILSITCVYRVFDIKKLLYLITAFTLGHSVTLALATLKWIRMDANWIEFLIPCTILCSALGNLRFRENKLRTKEMPWGNYALVTGFGLIHGMGFSNYLQSLLGQEASLLTPLFAFNVGLEIGQIIVVAIFLTFSTFLLEVMKSKLRHYVLVISGLIIGLVLPMILERWPL